MKKQTLFFSALLFTGILLVGCLRIGLQTDVVIANFERERSFEAQEFEIGITVLKDDYYCLIDVHYTDEENNIRKIDDVANLRTISGPWFTLTIPDDMQSLHVQLDSNSYGFKRELDIQFDNSKNEEVIFEYIKQNADLQDTTEMSIEKIKNKSEG